MINVEGIEYDCIPAICINGDRYITSDRQHLSVPKEYNNFIKYDESYDIYYSKKNPYIYFLGYTTNSEIPGGKTIEEYVYSEHTLAELRYRMVCIDGSLYIYIDGDRALSEKMPDVETTYKKYYGTTEYVIVEEPALDDVVAACEYKGIIKDVDCLYPTEDLTGKSGGDKILFGPDTNGAPVYLDKENEDKAYVICEGGKVEIFLKCDSYMKKYLKDVKNKRS